MVEIRVCRHPSRLVGGIALLAVVMVIHGMSRQLPSGLWWKAIFRPDFDDVRQLLFDYSFLPRLAVSLLCGAALALAGTIFQQVMRNPLAEPTTLGVSAGAALALSLSQAVAPGLLAYGQEGVALAGAAVAMLAVFGLAWGRGLAPLNLVLAGLIVSLYCGAIAAGVQLFQNPYSVSFYLWGAGSLSQQDWSVALYLLPRLAVSVLAVVLMARPLALLGLEDEGARSLGVSLLGIRLMALAVSVALSAFVVGAVGVIGFIGLAAPVLVRMAGARRFGTQLLWAPLLGAGLLCVTDQAVQCMFADGREGLPTGAATALLGAPLLLWMLPRLRAAGGAPPQTGSRDPSCRFPYPWFLVMVGLLGLAVAVFVSLHLGQNGYGWHWDSVHDLAPLLRWRAPRLFGSLAAGAMLAVAGVLMQRMTGNPMASPEILGIGGGAALGLVLLVMFSPVVDRFVQLGACALGAFGMLGIILFIGRRTAYAPTRILLAGIATGALSGVLTTIFLASGGPRAMMLKNWLAGATNLTTANEAIFACVSAMPLFALVPWMRRWLEILPLGTEVPRALGVDLSRSRWFMLLLVAALTAAATLTVGPLGFVGLMGPHLARMAGLRRPLPHLAGAAVFGALIMIVADWLGRTLMFPYQIPAGLIATLIGGPWLMLLLRRQSA